MNDTLRRASARRRIRAGVSLLLAICWICGCGVDRPASLDLRFGEGAVLCYRMDVTVDLTRGGSTAGATVCLRPSAGDPTLVVVALEQLEVNSTILDPAETEHSRQRLEGAQFRFRYRDGALFPLDSTALVDLRFGGWDLYRVLGRTIPALPASPVRKGQSWEREQVFPLDAAFGTAAGHLYRTFTLDSIRSRGAERLAYVSWEFTYRVELIEGDAPKVPQTLLKGGRGSGSAVIDAAAGKLLDGRSEFRVPGEGEAVWRESASLSRVTEG